ncbi:MAG: class I SAM-dependent methyltransferase [Firmicutes bacterium]|nr:class I SAM-dependent methyltransferase [Bacillota bacterium]NBI64363.1 class I SAM-dependent methyltransferase [Clostridiales bacterium]
MKQTIAYYNENAEEFCQTTQNADMRFCREKFLTILRKSVNTTDFQTNGRYMKPDEIHQCQKSKNKIHILDAGCGSGRDAKAFLDLGYCVTALDASEKVCQQAEKFIKQEVVCTPFEEMDFVESFHGIWACASLLHITKKHMTDVLQRLRTALKKGGILYASFKYGIGERTTNGRFFNDYTADELAALIASCHFSIEEIFITQDVRPNREHEPWLNVLARKSR